MGVGDTESFCIATYHDELVNTRPVSLILILFIYVCNIFMAGVPSSSIASVMWGHMSMGRVREERYLHTVCVSAASLPGTGSFSPCPYVQTVLAHKELKDICVIC